MTTASVYYAKNNLSKLLEMVARGERVIITNRGNRVAELNKPKPVKKPFMGLFGSMNGDFELTDKFEWTDTELDELFYENNNVLT